MIQPLKIEEILVNVDAITTTLEQAQQITPNDLDNLCRYLTELSAIQSLVTDTHASVKHILLTEKEQVLNKILKAEIEGVDKNGNHVTVKVAPSIQKIFAECRVKDYEYLYTKTERLTSNVSHAIDAVRTLISNAKQEQYFTRTQNN